MKLVNRRGFIKSAPIAAIAAATQAAAFQAPITEPPDADPIRKWFEQWRAGVAQFDLLEEESHEANCLFDANMALEKKICTTKATSRDGLIAQLDLALDPRSCPGMTLSADERDMEFFGTIREGLTGGLV